MPDPIILNLARAELDYLGACIGNAERTIGQALTGRMEDLDALQQAIDAGKIDTDDALKVEGIGAAFGNAMAHRGELRWVAVVDTVGYALGLQRRNTTCLCFPIEMLHKRFERCERPNLRELAETVLQMIGDMQADEHDDGWAQPIYGVQSIDLSARRNEDGGGTLAIALVGTLYDDARVETIFDAKLETYLHYIDGPEYKDRFTPIDEARALIQLYVEEAPTPAWEARLAQLREEVDARGVDIEVVVRGNES